MCMCIWNCSTLIFLIGQLTSWTHSPITLASFLTCNCILSLMIEYASILFLAAAVINSRYDNCEEKCSHQFHYHYNSLRCPVKLSNTLTGAGPIASTVLDPAAICVRPASSTIYVINPFNWAIRANSFRASSLSTLRATFAYEEGIHDSFRRFYSISGHRRCFH